MAGRTPQEAFRNYITPLQKALQCVTDTRLTLAERRQIIVDQPYAVVLNDMDPVLLQGVIPLNFTAGQTIRVVQTEPSDPRGPFKVTTVRYFYQIATSDSREILSYHWTPEEQGEGVVTFPHLHVGPVLVSGQSVIRPKDFHKAHIPTERVSIEAVIRLLITEFGVKERNPRWKAILTRGEQAFRDWKTR